MQFVEISGAVLFELTEADEAPQLRAAGVTDDTRIRINRQGDIEMFQNGDWAVIGGLLGDYRGRIKRVTGLDWQ